MKLTKINYGKYQKQADGSFSIVNHNKDKVSIRAGDVVGLSYAIESDAFVTASIENKYTYPNGKTKVSHSQADSKGEWGSILTFHQTEKLEEGKYIYEVTLLDFPEIAPISQVFYIYKANRGTLFSINHFPTDEKSISDFEQKFGFLFCEDYRRFLLDKNGINFFWWELPDFDTVRNQPDFWQKLEEHLNRTEWIQDVSIIFGLNHPEYHYDLERDLLHHVPKEFIPYLYPIGIDGGGNALLQIAQGKKKGKLVMLDHEISSLLDDMLQVENGAFKDIYGYTHKYPFKDFASATPDELIDTCISSGALHFYDLTFEQALEVLINLNTKAYESLRAHYG